MTGVFLCFTDHDAERIIIRSGIVPTLPAAPGNERDAF
jgi:hypothetical protein